MNHKQEECPVFRAPTHDDKESVNDLTQLIHVTIENWHCWTLGALVHGSVTEQKNLDLDRAYDLQVFWVVVKLFLLEMKGQPTLTRVRFVSLLWYDFVCGQDFPLLRDLPFLA